MALTPLKSTATLSDLEDSDNSIQILNDFSVLEIVDGTKHLKLSKEFLPSNGGRLEIQDGQILGSEFLEALKNSKILQNMLLQFGKILDISPNHIEKLLLAIIMTQIGANCDNERFELNGKRKINGNSDSFKPVLDKPDQYNSDRIWQILDNREGDDKNLYSAVESMYNAEGKWTIVEAIRKGDEDLHSSFMRSHTRFSGEKTDTLSNEEIKSQFCDPLNEILNRANPTPDKHRTRDDEFFRKCYDDARVIFDTFFKELQSGRITGDQHLALLSVLDGALDPAKSALGLCFIRGKEHSDVPGERKTGFEGSYRRMMELYNVAEILEKASQDDSIDDRSLMALTLYLRCEAAEVVRLRKDFFVNDVTLPRLKAEEKKINEPDYEGIVIEDVACGSGAYVRDVLKKVAENQISPDTIKTIYLYDADTDALDAAMADIEKVAREERINIKINRYRSKQEEAFLTKNIQAKPDSHTIRIHIVEGAAELFSPREKADLRINAGLGDYFAPYMGFENSDKKRPDDEKINKVRPDNALTKEIYSPDFEGDPVTLKYLLIQMYNNLKQEGETCIGIFSKGKQNEDGSFKGHKDRAIMALALDWGLIGVQSAEEMYANCLEIGIPEDEISLQFVDDKCNPKNPVLLKTEKYYFQIPKDNWNELHYRQAAATQVITHIKRSSDTILEIPTDMALKNSLAMKEACIRRNYSSEMLKRKLT